MALAPCHCNELEHVALGVEPVAGTRGAAAGRPRLEHGGTALAEVPARLRHILYLEDEFEGRLLARPRWIGDGDRACDARRDGVQAEARPPEIQLYPAGVFGIGQHRQAQRLVIELSHPLDV